MSQFLDVLVVGGGPTGLACAIEAIRAGLKLAIVEKGCLVNSLYSYPANMTFFTTRERLEIGDIPFSSVNVKPTRAEALEYYRRVADFYKLPVHYDEKVTAIHGVDGVFETATERSTGRRATYKSRKVIVATGYYDLPNRIGIPGEDLPKVSHYALEGHAFFGRKVAVIGGANSAAVTALDLYRHEPATQCARSLPRGSCYFRPEHQRDLYRERTVSREADHRGYQAATDRSSLRIEAWGEPAECARCLPHSRQLALPGLLRRI